MCYTNHAGKERERSVINKNTLMEEIETLPANFINEVYHYVSFLKNAKGQIVNDEITMSSEAALAKSWLLPEEDVAWADL